MINRNTLRQRNIYSENVKNELNECIEENKTIPYRYRKDASKILNDMIYNTEEKETFQMPKVCVSTSNKPSAKLKEFSKHISLIFNGEYVKRAGENISGFRSSLSDKGFTHVIIINEVKGNPSSLIISSLVFTKTYYFTLSALNFVRRSRPMKRRVDLVLDGMNGEKYGVEFYNILSMAFPKVVEDDKKEKKSSRLVAIINKNGRLFFKHFLIDEYKKLEKDTSFTLKLFKITNSTFDTEGDGLYQISSFINTTGNEDILND